jgi:hypothetical protein
MNNQFDVLAILVEYPLDGAMVSDVHIVVDIFGPDTSRADDCDSIPWMASFPKKVWRILLSSPTALNPRSQKNPTDSEPISPADPVIKTVFMASPSSTYYV